MWCNLSALSTRVAAWEEALGNTGEANPTVYSKRVQLRSGNKCWEELRVIHVLTRAKGNQCYLEAIKYTN